VSHALESRPLPSQTLAETLASRGVASIRMDFPGCGASVEPFTENNITNMMADVAAARAFAIANAAIDSTAVGMFGYSMGGRVAILSASSGYKSLGLLAPLGNDGNVDPNFSLSPQKYAPNGTRTTRRPEAFQPFPPFRDTSSLPPTSRIP
jgi:dienelactone hydrolase